MGFENLDMEILAGGGDGGDLGAPKIASNCSSAVFAIFFLFFLWLDFFNAIFLFPFMELFVVEAG